MPLDFLWNKGPQWHHSSECDSGWFSLARPMFFRQPLSRHWCFSAKTFVITPPVNDFSQREEKRMNAVSKSVKINSWAVLFTTCGTHVASNWRPICCMWFGHKSTLTTCDTWDNVCHREESVENLNFYLSVSLLLLFFFIILHHSLQYTTLYHNEASLQWCLWNFISEDDGVDGTLVSELGLGLGV